ncbi:MAG: hypothetical protein JXA00_04250 [Candidatus Thermoplasmatota archaeon]|nr:hypothetical protein [Candidatus Thermoplasmatota archaeon]
MKKFIPLVIIGIVVLSGLGAAALQTHPTVTTLAVRNQETTTVVFSSAPSVIEEDGFVTLTMPGTTTHLLEQNAPLLPLYVKTFTLPWGSQHIQITATPQQTHTMSLTKQVAPARIAPVSQLDNQPYVTDPAIYASSELYPYVWSTSELGAGRDATGEQVVFAKIVCYPVRYSPAQHQIIFSEGFDIRVSYDAPTPQPTTGEQYDMVIIAPETFEAKLQPLITHKNEKGVATLFKSIEDIFDEYTGADPPEQVKYFIKDMYDTYSITYVLLVGGLKSHLYAKDKEAISYGSAAWHIPVRYVSIPMDEDEACLCDVYYGCLYNATGAFDSWDSNGDGVYAAYSAPGYPNDVFDMYPEVYVGRLACTNTREVGVVVDKIITYESSGIEDKPWYKNFVAIGGKTFALYQGIPDGEYLTNLAMTYMTNVIPDLVPVKCYTTNRDTGGRTPIPKDIIKSFNEGAGFVDFEGHGNPYSWNTIWHDGTYPEDWTGGVNVFLFPFIHNKEQLPVVIVGGCHNGLYNVTLLGSLLDTDGHDYFCYNMPIPFCFCWGLVVKGNGGAIASTGCTGYGFGSSGDPVALSAELEMNFFWQIGNNSVTNLGTAHSTAIQKYINENTMSRTGAFCITNWQLFGDPSLKFGGYSS